MDFFMALLFLPALVIGLTVHEFSHAYSAKLLGDKYPASMGRVSLNPFRHLSLIGTLAIFLVGFGWGNPVVVNLYNFKKPKLYYMLTSLAGPASNVILAGISLGVLHLWRSDICQLLFVPLFVVNSILAIFNLIPIPPLDGSKIWLCIFPNMKPTISGKWSWFWLVILIISVKSGAIGRVISPGIDFLMGLVPCDGYMTDVRPEGFPPSIYAPVGATDILYYEGEGSDEYSYEMTFSYEEEYPATGLQKTISSCLEKSGWCQLKYDLADPNEALTGEWYQEDEDGYKDRELESDWYNSKDETLVVYLMYNSDNGEELPSVADVWMYFDSADSSSAQWLKEYKTAHPEEFQDDLSASKDSPDPNGMQ